MKTLLIVLCLLALSCSAFPNSLNLAAQLPAIAPVMQTEPTQPTLIDKALEIWQAIDARAQLTYATETGEARLSLTGTMPVFNINDKVAVTVAGMLLTDDGLKWGAGPGIRIKDLFRVLDINAAWILQENQFVIGIDVAKF